MDSSAIQPSTEPAAQPGWFRRVFFAPVIGPMIRERRLAVGIAIGLAAQMTAGLFALPGMPCPTSRALGFPCPGCGATRAAAAFVHGQFARSFDLHLFGFLFLGVLALFAFAAVLPEARRDRLAAVVEWTENRLGVTNLLLVGLLLYWAYRLLYDFGGFTRLVAGGQSG